MAKFSFVSEADKLLTVDGTIAGPTANAIAIPKYPANVPMAVAVVRSLGGNHVAETSGGAPMATGPPAIVIN